MAFGWATSTRATYGSGLLLFHAFCDNRGIPEAERAPASTQLLESFIAALVGSYAATTLSNVLAGVRAWHIAHRLPWSVDKDGMKTLLQAGKSLAPPELKQAERVHYSVDYLEALYPFFQLSSPRDAAVWACLHVKIEDVKELVFDKEYFGRVMSFSLPFTKSAQSDGEKIFWAKQKGPTNPKAAFDNHITVNNPKPGEHLFSHTSSKKRFPLTRHMVLSRLKALTNEAGLEQLQGHGFRSGGTMEYILRGIPFEVVKTFGRWKSDAWQLYLREHGQILAPYIQADVDLRAIPNFQAPRIR
ncbi:hypothetical protein K474DRAFT_1685524 [Panus rudis PR-1116 ss-1]|nr:hypothetical protein K474DRAFT_1685524 [Panus rudis PR-1116 ss-1]